MQYEPIELFSTRTMYRLRENTPAQAATETVIRRDLEKIYVTVKCHEPAAINTASSGNAYVVWEGDNLEVILGNLGEHPWYRHFVVGAGGGRHSIYAGLDEWRGEVTVLEDHYWEAEFEIPLCLLGSYDSTLRFNLLRQRVNDNEIQTAAFIDYGHDLEVFLEIPAALPANAVKHGPWVHQVTAHQAALGWETCGEASSMPELRMQGEESYKAVGQISVHEDGKLRRAQFDSLQADTLYEYRIGNVHGEFRTMKDAEDDFSFMLLADTHDDAQRFGKILQHPEIQDCDFAVYLGDMLTSSLDRALYYDAFLDASVKYWHKPFHYVRGNHEFRGRGREAFYDLFGKGNYAFSHGGIMFILLEIEGDLPPAEKARWNEMQKVFLQELVQSAEFKTARSRIILSHVAPLLPETAEGQAAEDIFSVLPPGSVDLFISGHKHSYSYIGVNSDKIESLNKKRFGGKTAYIHDYPLLITHYAGFLRVDRQGKKLTVQAWDQNDKKVDTKEFILE